MRPTMDVDLTDQPAEEVDAPWPGGADPGAPERADEELHFGRAWHRYRYCYRKADGLRVLVAGCGNGRSSVWAARLNPGATVLGLDASPALVDRARGRAAAAGLGGAVTFRTHDLAEPIPNAWGRFDFVAGRGVLGRAADPARVLTALAGALAPDGLLSLTLPSHAGRQVARALRQAVDALAPPGAGEAARRALARDLVRSLRPGHPILLHLGPLPPDADNAELDRALAGSLDDCRDWTLDGAAALLARAGLRFLYAATPWRWRADRVFEPGALPEPVRLGVERLAPDAASRLVDALDPSLLGDAYQVFACPADHTPDVPRWPATRRDDPAGFDRLVPEPTGLARVDAGPASGGRVAYRTISGTPGELDRMSALLLAEVDGAATCGAIEARLAPRTRASDDLETRQGRWIDLADGGLILLRPGGA